MDADSLADWIFRDYLLGCKLRCHGSSLFLQRDQETKRQINHQTTTMQIRKNNMLEILHIAHHVLTEFEEKLGPDFKSARRQAVEDYIQEIESGDDVIYLDK